MRFRSLFLCMRATNDELDLALRRRVDAMLAAGLVEELEAFAAKANGASDDARGASQSIGFHEVGEVPTRSRVRLDERRGEGG